jgi:Arc/MetJ-type ribon-helix-helix transcriptional regulator
VVIPTITFRPDDESERALATLTADGRSASAAIRDALVHDAQRREDERLRAEAAALAADPDDVAEARRVLEDLEPLPAW